MGPFLAALPGIAGLLGKLFGGGAKGSTAERTNRNQFQQGQNSQALQQYGMQQQALLSALLGADRGAMDRYQTQQGATSHALNSGSQEATSRYGIQQGAQQRALESQSAEGLQRARLGLEAPNARARQSLLGSLMQNMQPVSVEGGNARVRANMPKITGGLSPSAIDPTTRQHGGALMQAALQAQLSGSDVPAATNFQGGVLQAPAATDFRSGVLQPPPGVDYTKGILPAPNMAGYQQPGRGESWLAGGSIVGGILGELLPLILNNRSRGATPSDEAGYG